MIANALARRFEWLRLRLDKRGTSIASFVLTALLLLVLAAQASTLTKYPAVFIDESWNSNAAWNWLRTGVNVDSMHSGTLDQFGYEWISRSYLGGLPWVVAFKLAGVGLFQARAVSFLFGVTLLLAAILIGFKCFGLHTGLLGGLLLSLSSPFIISSHYARQDIILSAVVMCLFGLSLVVFEKNRIWPHFFLGLGLGLATDIHQNAILFFPGFFSLYALAHQRRVLRRPEFWAWAAGAAGGILYFLSIHILPSPETYFLYLQMNDTVLQSATGLTHTPPILSLNVQTLMQSVRGELGRFHFYENSLDFALITASLAFIAFRRQTYDWVFLTFMTANFASFTLIQGSKVYFYDILVVPLYFMLAAEALMSLVFDTQAKNLQRLFALCLALAVIVNGVRHFGRGLNENRSYDYYSITDEIKSVLRPDDRILGTPTWWLGLTEYDYKSAFMLSHHFYFNDLSLADAMERIAPTILIVDDKFFSLFENIESSAADPAGIKKLSVTEAQSFIECCTEELLSIHSPQHGGDLIVYRIVNTEWTK